MQRRQFTKAGIAASILGVSYAQPTLAQSQMPLEHVKFYFGFPAGSSGDIVARRVGDKIAGSAYAKNGAVVENKPGAGGRIALDVLKPMPADGSHLTLTPYSMLSLYPHVYAKLGYDAFKDFVPVSMAAIMYHGLAVGPMVPASVTDVKGFLAWCKANPDKANYGSPGAGSTPHFIGALLGLNNNTDMKHVPYRGSVPGVTDVVGGQIASMVTPHGDFLANHKAGKLRIIGVSGAKRSPFVPEVATFAEQGFPELTVDEWFAFLRTSWHPCKRCERCQRRNQQRPQRQIRHRQPGAGRLDRPRLYARRAGCQPEAAIRPLGPADQEDWLHRRVLIRQPFCTGFFPF